MTTLISSGLSLLKGFLVKQMKLLIVCQILYIYINNWLVTQNISTIHKPDHAQAKFQNFLSIVYIFPYYRFANSYVAVLWHIYTHINISFFNNEHHRWTRVLKFWDNNQGLHFTRIPSLLMWKKSMYYISSLQAVFLTCQNKQVVLFECKAPHHIIAQIFTLFSTLGSFIIEPVV